MGMQAAVNPATVVKWGKNVAIDIQNAFIQ